MNLNDLLTTKKSIDLEHELNINSINKSGYSRNKRRNLIKKANDIYWLACLDLKSTVKSESK
jgi:hypothetical protein